MSKEILFNIEARDQLKKGVDSLANAVKVTLGPKGRNVIIEKKFGAPHITKDGVSVAKEIESVNNCKQPARSSNFSRHSCRYCRHAPPLFAVRFPQAASRGEAYTARFPFLPSWHVAAVRRAAVRRPLGDHQHGYATLRYHTGEASPTAPIPAVEPDHRRRVLSCRDHRTVGYGHAEGHQLVPG